MSSRAENTEDSRIILNLLDSVERDASQSQRRLASDLGIALGLVNAYLKRCVKKGLLKVGTAPARRYAYYLTPQGLAEKSRLTVEYLSVSFSFFRRAKADCAHVFATVQARGFRTVALAGASDLAEIASICALESGIQIIAVVDARSTTFQFVGVPLVRSFEDVPVAIDAIIITDLTNAEGSMTTALAHLDASRVFMPALLGMRSANQGEGSA